MHPAPNIRPYECARLLHAVPALPRNRTSAAGAGAR